MSHYVIKNENDQYIGIDQASGGYPFSTTSLTSAKIFVSIGDASEYKKAFPSEVWTLHEISVSTSPVGWIVY